VALFELTDLAAYLQQDLDTATAEQCRTKATNYLRSELAVEFTEAARTLTDRVSVTRTYLQLLGPLVSVESVAVGSVPLTEVSDWERTKRGIVCPAGFGFATLTSAAWVDLVVAYTAGFDIVPDDLRDAGIHLAGIAYLRSPNPGVKSSTVTLDDFTESVAYEDGGETGGLRDPMVLDEMTLRSLRARYGSARPRSGSVQIR
jgi:antitoxin component HigA of HigAB toxin-antitoxin module